MASVRRLRDDDVVKTGEEGKVTEEHRSFIRLKSKSGTEHVYYSLLYEGFPEEFQNRAEKELKETPEGRKQGLRRLREYMKNQNMVPLEDDTIMLASLRNCKYNMTKAEVKLKKYVSLRRKMAVKLREMGMEKMEYILDDMPCGLLPYRDKHGSAIIFTRPYGIRLDRYTLSDAAVIIATEILYLMSFPITSVAGFAYFAECKSPSLYFLYTITLKFKEYMFEILSLPIRVASVEVLNENYIVRWFFNIVRPFLSNKMSRRVIEHGSNVEQFFKMFDPNIIPEEFGGNAGRLSSHLYKQKLMDFARVLIEESNNYEEEK